MSRKSKNLTKNMRSRKKLVQSATSCITPNTSTVNAKLFSKTKIQIRLLRTERAQKQGTPRKHAEY